MSARRPRRLARHLVPLLAPWLILLAVNQTGTPAPVARAALPHEPFVEARCTWYCHNHGCRHPPRLPAALTGDRGLFGRTIKGLFAAGSVASSDRPVGYGIANLALFCLIWPGLMYALLLVAMRQRDTLRALRRGEDA